jgi:conjugal transfer pilus assembly protein TraD
MSPDAGSARRRPPYWTLAAFAVLLVIPAAWAGAALLAAAAVMGAVAIVRETALRRARAPAATGTDRGVTLGTDAGGAPVVLGDSQLSAHGLILGASGSGKSTTLLSILTDQIGRGNPVIVLDLKGSPAFAGELAAAAAAAGRPFKLFSPDGPSRWNPLAHGNATQLKDKLIASERFTEPHYQRAAERYVQTVLQVLQATHPDRAAELHEVVALMDPRRLSGALRALPRERAARVQDYVASLTPDQQSAIRGFATRLALISESNVGPWLASEPGTRPEPGTGPEPGTRPERDAIDLRAALEGREIVLFSLNSSTYGKLASQLGTLAIQDLIAAAGHRLEASSSGKLPQATIGIDEFSALGTENVIGLLARGREAGFSVVLVTQELADLDRAGRGMRDQVVGNTAVKIAHRQDVPASAQMIAEMAGTRTVWEETEQIGNVWSGGYGRRGTRREVERFVVHPNQIKSLRTGEAVMITKLPRAIVRLLTVSPPQPAPDATRHPPTQAPPAQTPPAQSPRAQSPPAQTPPAQSPRAQTPPARVRAAPRHGPSRGGADGPAR